MIYDLIRPYLSIRSRTICSKNFFLMAKNWKLDSLIFILFSKLEFWKSENKISHIWKKFFYWFLLLELHKYRLIRPKIITFYQNWNFIFQSSCSSLCPRPLDIRSNIMKKKKSNYLPFFWFFKKDEIFISHLFSFF